MTPVSASSTQTDEKDRVAVVKELELLQSVDVDLRGPASATELPVPK